VFSLPIAIALIGVMTAVSGVIFATRFRETSISDFYAYRYKN
jgi:hypothetical protein